MMTHAWIRGTGAKFVLVQESGLFPGHQCTLPNTFGNRKAAEQYARRHAMTLHDGECPLPRMPQGRPVRDDLPTKAELRTLSQHHEKDA